MAGFAVGGWSDLGPSFVRRVGITTGWCGAIVSLCIAVYLSGFSALSFFAGVLLGIADLLLLDLWVREILLRRRAGYLVLYSVLKFAGLYAAGAALLVWARLHPIYLIAGFTLFLAVAVLKAAGRLLLGSRWMRTGRTGSGGPLLRRGTNSGGRSQ